MVPCNVYRTRLHFRDRLRTNLDRASIRDGRLLGRTATPVREDVCRDRGRSVQPSPPWSPATADETLLPTRESTKILIYWILRPGWALVPLVLQQPAADGWNRSRTDRDFRRTIAGFGVVRVLARYGCSRCTRDTVRFGFHARRDRGRLMVLAKVHAVTSVVRLQPEDCRAALPESLSVWRLQAGFRNPSRTTHQ